MEIRNDRARLRLPGGAGLPRQLGGDLYVRSMYGRSGGWFSATQVRHRGHIRAGGVMSPEARAATVKLVPR